jgi:hypothetical protein
MQRTLLADIDRRGRIPLTSTSMARVTRLMADWSYSLPVRRRRVEAILARAGVTSMQHVSAA